jgi:hypothetical protein
VCGVVAELQWVQSQADYSNENRVPRPVLICGFLIANDRARAVIKGSLRGKDNLQHTGVDSSAVSKKGFTLSVNR